jgi:hypothetical protein
MSWTEPDIGQGATLGYKIAPASVYTPINFLVSITPPDFVVGNADISNLAKNIVFKRPTVGDPGECGFVVQFGYQDTTHSALKTLLLTYPQPQNTGWQITLPDGTTSTFTGFLTSFKEDEVEQTNPVEAEGSIMLTSIPVYVAGTGA